MTKMHVMYNVMHVTFGISLIQTLSTFILESCVITSLWLDIKLLLILIYKLKLRRYISTVHTLPRTYYQTYSGN